MILARQCSIEAKSGVDYVVQHLNLSLAGDRQGVVRGAGLARVDIMDTRGTFLVSLRRTDLNFDLKEQGGDNFSENISKAVIEPAIEVIVQSRTR